MSRPWMPLYVADYLRDTRKLTAAEHGAYLLLIMEYWTCGSLPDDDRQLARIASMSASEWRKARPNVEGFFHDGWKHKRLDAELARSAEISSKRAASAKQRHSNSSANAEQVDTHAGATSQSPSPSKKDHSPDGLTTTGKAYAFEDGIIRLNERDFEAWRKAFRNLDLAAELLSLSKWAESEGKNWFHAVKGALAKRNREVKAAAENRPKQGQPNWLDGIEGVI